MGRKNIAFICALYLISFLCARKSIISKANFVLFYLNCKIGILLIVHHFITLWYFRENWYGNLRKKKKLRKLLTQRPLTNFLRCLRMSKMKIKGHIGLKIISRMICYNIGMHLVIVRSVHRQKKIKHLKRVGVCT